MIQTQLLKADKPYQIISAAGLVGIQVATLIVTEEKIAKDGSYLIDTHSHPVVNYGNKEGLTEDLKYYNGDPSEEYKYSCRMQPEGAVWNRVEIRDVQVLGLVGAKNSWLDIERFISLVPSVSNDPSSHMWDNTTPGRMRSIFISLDRVGIKISRSVLYSSSDRDFNQIIFVELEENEGNYQVLVKIRDVDYTSPDLQIYPIYFRCSLDDNLQYCIDTIGRCFAVLYNHFDFNRNLKFVYKYTSANQDGEWTEQLETIIESINKNWRSYLTEG